MSSKSISVQQIPPKSRAITSIGDKTAEAVIRLFRSETGSLFEDEDEGLDLDPLTDALKKTGWSDEQTAELINAYANVLDSDRKVNISTLSRWVLQHPNDAEQVKECLTTIPPEEIDIIKVLSRAGSQKVVFLATWRLTQADIVLKKVIASTEATERILSRELRSNPLNMVHQNIIETYILRNTLGEAFLVERKLSDVLSDKWRSNGIHEAANLLFDIGKAVKFLHDQGLVHGDIKPDNLGKNRDTYILLDFGICREATAYTPDVTPTGSLRTRPPELLEESVPTHPEKVDIWALGATVFNSIKGRFPLIDTDEKVPRISKMDDREKFEQILKRRVAQEWERWVNFDGIPESLRTILRKMLEANPAKRISAKEVTELAKKELSAFIRSDGVRGEAATRFSPSEELQQIDQYLHSLPEMAKLLPVSKQKLFRDRLDVLSKAVGFGTEETKKIMELRELIV